MNVVIKYRMIKTNRRLTFEILEQKKEGFCGESDDKPVTYKFKNVEIISRSRMDIQTDRLWLLGCGEDMRSGSMVFSSNDKRDKMFFEFQEALLDWAENSTVNPDNMEVFMLQEYDTFTISF